MWQSSLSVESSVNRWTFPFIHSNWLFSRMNKWRNTVMLVSRRTPAPRLLTTGCRPPTIHLPPANRPPSANHPSAVHLPSIYHPPTDHHPPTMHLPSTHHPPTRPPIIYQLSTYHPPTRPSSANHQSTTAIYRCSRVSQQKSGPARQGRTGGEN